MNKKILKGYEILEKNTPLSTDCGLICNNKCCKGNDDDGMLLFPGEKEIFENNKDFTVYFDERYDCYAVRCNGSCNRNERPLSCRIFPYMIYKKASEQPTVAPDIRALNFCPILNHKYYINKRFLRALRITSKYLSDDAEISLFLEKLTDIITDFNSL